MNTEAPYPETKLCYTIQEAMQILRISRPTIYRTLTSGALKSKKVGGRRLITHKEINRFLDAA